MEVIQEGRKCLNHTTPEEGIPKYAFLFIFSYHQRHSYHLSLLLHLSYSLLFIFSFVPYSSCVPYSLNHELKVDTSGDRVLNIAVEVAARCKSDERGSNKSQ